MRLQVMVLLTAVLVNCGPVQCGRCGLIARFDRLSGKAVMWALWVALADQAGELRKRIIADGVTLRSSSTAPERVATLVAEAVVGHEIRPVEPFPSTAYATRQKLRRVLPHFVGRFYSKKRKS
jgi:hypothetical protein